MYDEIIGSISGFTNYLIMFALYGGFAVLSVLQIVSTAKLRSLKKRIQLFLDKSTKENFEAIRLDYKKIKKFYSITAIAGIAVNFAIWGMKDFWALLHFVAPGPIAVFGLLAVLITQLVMGVPMLQLGNLAEQRYRNLYPLVPTIQGFKQLEDERYVLHADEELFETLGEKDKISENLNLNIFGEGNEELLKYVGGGKAREKQAALPQTKEDNSELIECPLCGSLNPVGAESCDFCGTDLSNDLLNDEKTPLSSPKSKQGE